MRQRDIRCNKYFWTLVVMVDLDEMGIEVIARHDSRTGSCNVNDWVVLKASPQSGRQELAPGVSLGYKGRANPQPRGRGVRMAHTFTELLVHIVFSTSGRRPLLSDEIRQDVHAYLGGILRELHADPITIGGTADHIHVLTRLPADLAVADCLRVVKTNSSRWIKEKWPERRMFAWQGGYAAFSVSKSSRGAVLRYIQTQDQHHQRISFQQEFHTLLCKHGVEFDERYVWQ